MLISRLKTPAAIPVGRLGTLDFAAGYYGYVGSAFGPGGVRGRLAHHSGVSKRPHWHIDYLRQHAEILECWFLIGPHRREHEWAGTLELLAGMNAATARFGASDCGCHTHLFWSRQRPRLTRFAAKLRGQLPADPLPQRVSLS